MDEAQFWKIIDKTCRSTPHQPEEWNERLQAELEKLEPDEIVAWDQIFNRLTARAYTVDLWGAAYLINGGASEDGFYYFRCWLIGMGREVYEAAVADPDILADVVAKDIDAEAEIYAAACEAWLTVTGQPDIDKYPACKEPVELQGERWDFDDDEEVRRRLPRLAARYLDS
jgi:hypothetical protein